MSDLSLQQTITQSLELLLSPRMLQMLKVLNQPYHELVEHICQEAEENPVMEVERRDEYVEFIRYLTSDRKVRKEIDFDEMPGLENIGNVTKSLEKHLLEQLELEDIEEQQYEIAKKIIENIDDLGLVINYPRLRENIMKEFKISRPTVDKVLKIIQAFEPEGVGARDLKECLQIQVEEHNFDNPALKEILKKAIEKHLDDLGKKDFTKVAKALNISLKGAEEVGNFIKNNLNPNPGSSFGGETKHVIPSFAVEKTEEGLKVINLETRYGPVIKISTHYLKMIEDPKTDKKTKDFLREKLQKAKNLIEDFSKRSETLEKIVRKIVGTQTEFFDKGIIWMVPLSQKSLSEEFGLHPSTISRSVAAKYIQTPQGIFPLKSLCPRGPKGFTSVRIKVILAEIVKNEDKKNPLSDSQLTKAMKEKGVNIDRRTAAYYRKELSIPLYDKRRI